MGMITDCETSANSIISLRVTGGQKPEKFSKNLATKISHLKLPLKKVADDITKKTAEEWNGFKVTVKLTVQKGQVVSMEVVPSASSLIIKAFKEPYRDRKKTKHIKHSGTLSSEVLTTIAELMRSRSCAAKMDGTLREIQGTMRAV